MMLGTMAVSTLAFFALAVAASELQAEFGVSRLQLGLLGAANTLVGAAVAPAAGRVSDAIGPRKAVGATLVLSGIGAVLLAIAPTFPLLIAASALAGFAQGAGNPACNIAIFNGVEESRRGIVTGVKQSGVRTAVVLSGLSVPFLIANFGWRSAMWMNAVLAFLLLVGLGFVPEGQERREGEASAVQLPKLPPFVTQAAIYAFLLGTI